MHLNDLCGVWRRQVLELGEDRDDASAVYWVQGRALFCDIRVPREQTIGSLQPLEAFAGVLSGDEGRFTWNREIEWLLTPAPPDEGFLRWDGAVLREDGVHVPYVEYWERIALPKTGDCAVRLADPVSGREGFVIQLNAWTFYAFGRLPGSQVQTDCGFALAKDEGVGPCIHYATSDHLIGAPLQVVQESGADEIRVTCGKDSSSQEMRWEVVDRETLDGGRP